MINIKKATTKDSEVLALLGRITYVESHGHYIEDKNDLNKYINDAFSVSKTKQDIQSSNTIFYIIYVNELPVGYAKIVLNVEHKNIESQNNCRLDRIYILNEFIPLKIGQQLLCYVQEQARDLQLDTIWLSVYTKNKRAIRFYERNTFKNVGELNFLVNGTVYENMVFSKKLEV